MSHPTYNPSALRRNLGRSPRLPAIRLPAFPRPAWKGALTGAALLGLGSLGALSLLPADAQGEACDCVAVVLTRSDASALLRLLQWGHEDMRDELVYLTRDEEPLSVFAADSAVLRITEAVRLALSE